MKPMLKIAAVGVAVVSDLFGVPLSGLIYTPLLYVVVHGLTERFGSHAHRSALENH
jgi:multidrug efflux pump